MTWAEFKKVVEAQGVTDDMILDSIQVIEPQGGDHDALLAPVAVITAVRGAPFVSFSIIQSA